MKWQLSTDQGKTWHDIDPSPLSVLVNSPQSFEHHDGVMDDTFGNWYRRVPK